MPEPEQSGIYLAINCGSSSIRFSGFEDNLQKVLHGHVQNIGLDSGPQVSVDGQSIRMEWGAGTHAEILPELVADVILPRAGGIVAVGHRVVHGGTRFTEPVLVDARIRSEIAELVPLAPSHQPHNLAGIDAIADALPGVPQVACFDTAFHQTIPAARRRMPLPRRYHEEGLRRYGFHGLSYERIVQQLHSVAGAAASGCVIIAHLGNGCSLAGLRNLRSAYTSMGFTPLDGLMMGRRPGRLDPGAVLWLVKRHGGDTETVANLLNKDSGLLGVSSQSSDMRVLLADDREDSKLAVDMFIDRLVQEIGTAAAAIAGLDALVFTGGIGENASSVRAEVARRMAWMGLEVDEQANQTHVPTISSERSKVSIHVIPTDEEHVIAAAAARLVSGLDCSRIR